MKLNSYDFYHDDMQRLTYFGQYDTLDNMNRDIEAWYAKWPEEYYNSQHTYTLSDSLWNLYLSRDKTCDPE